MNTTSKLLTIKEVAARFRLSRSSIYRLMRLGHFPEPIRVGLGAVRWPEDEIEQYIQAQPRAKGNG